MVWTVVLASDSFKKGPIVVSSGFITVSNAQTNKTHSYKIQEDLLSIQILEINEVTTLLNGIKNLGVMVTAGIVGAVSTTALLGTVAAGSALPNHSKSELIVSLVFKDGKSAVVRMSQKTYNKIIKKFH